MEDHSPGNVYRRRGESCLGFEDHLVNLIVFATRRGDAALAHAATLCLGNALSGHLDSPMGRFFAGRTPARERRDGRDLAPLLRDVATAADAILSTFRSLKGEVEHLGDKDFVAALGHCEALMRDPGSPCAFAKFQPFHGDQPGRLDEPRRS